MSKTAATDTTRLLNLLTAAADSVDNMTDDEIAAELALEDRSGPSVGDIIAKALKEH